MLQHPLAMLFGVQYLRVPLDAGKAPADILERGNGSPWLSWRSPGIQAGLRSPVAVGHPCAHCGGQASEQDAGIGHIDCRSAVFPAFRCERLILRAPVPSP